MKTKRHRIIAGAATAALVLTSCSLKSEEGHSSNIPANEILAETIHSLSQNDTLNQGVHINFDLKIKAKTSHKSKNNVDGGIKGDLIIEPNTLKFALTAEIKDPDTFFPNSSFFKEQSIEMYGEPSGDQYIIYEKFGNGKWKTKNESLEMVEREFNDIFHNPYLIPDKEKLKKELQKKISDVEKYITITTTEDSDSYTIKIAPTDEGIKRMSDTLQSRTSNKLSKDNLVADAFLKINKKDHLPTQLGVTLNGHTTEGSDSAELDLLVDFAIPSDAKVSIPEEAQNAR